MARVCLLYYLGMWLYETRTISSEKNPKMTLERFFGRWKLNVGLWDQTTPYTNGMWKNALQRLPEDFVAKDILLLGLGGGGLLPLLQKKFGHCKITAVEWDPAMIEVAKIITLDKYFSKVKILNEDALKVVEGFAKEQKQFDLVILDLFQGHDVAQAAGQKEFYANIASILKKPGIFLANIFSEPEKSKLIEEYLEKQRVWKYRYNNLGFYQRKDLRILPQGFTHHRNVKEFLLREYSTGWVKVVNKGKVWGSRNDLGPIRFERYITDEEPEIFPDDKFRMIIWQPLTRGDKPNEWRRSWDQLGVKRNGFAEIKHPEKYWEDWEPHGQRHRTKWLAVKDVKWEIYEPTLEEFITAYKKIKFDGILRGAFIDILKKKVQKHGKLVHLFGARKPGGKLEAGFACVDVPEGNQSFHCISFHSDVAREDSVGTGLMDEWFKRSISKGYRFLDFCVFWAPGEDKKWKGFSRFKSQFGVQFIDYPKPLIKFVKANKKA